MKEVRADIRRKLLWGLADCREKARKNNRELTKCFCYFTASAINSIVVLEESKKVRCLTQSRKNGDIVAESYVPYDLIERMDEKNA